MDQKFSLNRCVTVNFNNQSSRTLNKTSDDFLYDTSLHNVQAPKVIQPGESVTWDQKLGAEFEVQGNATYSFSLDNGASGNLSVAWDNPLSGSNTYSLSSAPSGLFFISYTGGGGTEATIDVRFYEVAYGYTQWSNLISLPDQQTVEATDANTVIAAPSSAGNSRDSLQWNAVDPWTGASVEWMFGQTSGKFKMINRNYKSFLTASDWQNNKVCLFLGNDGPDQYWYWDGDGRLVNGYSNLALIPSGSDGLVVAPPQNSTWIMGSF